MKIIQSDLKNYNIDEAKNMKLKIEKALFSKTKEKYQRMILKDLWEEVFKFYINTS